MRKSDQRWEMRATREEKKIIRRAADRLHLTQAGLVKLLIRIAADEMTQEKQTDEENHPTAA